MKLLAVIKESPYPDHNHVIVQFSSDKKKQLFKVFIESPYQRRMRLFDEWLLDIKFRSIVMKDLEGNKTFDTELYCEIAVPASDMMKKARK